MYKYSSNKIYAPIWVEMLRSIDNSVDIDSIEYDIALDNFQSITGFNGIDIDNMFEIIDSED